MRYLSTLNFLILILFVFITASCDPDKQPDAQQIVDQAIEAHGGERFERMAVSFQLRDKQYRALRDKGAFVYSRSFVDSTGQQIHDVLRNSGFSRSVDNQEIEVAEAKATAYSSSVNSVIYFALLPYFLNDAAVEKQYIGDATIKGESYHKVKVTFKVDGGGESFEDVYIYWFHKKNKTMDYLAYSFKENDGGTRFREAINTRKIGDILFQDYINYTATEEIPLEQYDKVFEAGKLKKVSEINLEDIKVSDLPKE